jgi:hypothetical protein
MLVEKLIKQIFKRSKLFYFNFDRNKKLENISNNERNAKIKIVL